MFVLRASVVEQQPALSCGQPTNRHQRYCYFPPCATRSTKPLGSCTRVRFAHLSCVSATSHLLVLTGKGLEHSSLSFPPLLKSILVTSTQRIKHRLRLAAQTTLSVSLHLITRTITFLPPDDNAGAIRVPPRLLPERLHRVAGTLFSQPATTHLLNKSDMESY
jgi:hypothetical protein